MDKRRLVLWFCALFLAVVALLRCADDRYLLSYNGYELAGETHGNANGTASVTGEADTFTTPALWLNAGRYELVLNYTADEAGTRLYAESERALNPDNTLGRVLAETELDPGAAQVALPLEIGKGGLRDVRVNIAFSGAGTLALDGLIVRSGPVFYKDHIFLAAFVLLLAFGLDFYLFRKTKKPGDTFEARLARLAPAACVVALGLLASYPLFASILPAGHDLDFHLARIQGIADGFAGGQFPARVYPTQLNGKGYILGVMYPDLFLWPSALLRLCGVSLMGAYKALVLALNVGTAATAYWVGRRFFPLRIYPHARFAAGVVAVLYTLAPYRILNVYNRAALGEALAMVFLPLVAAGVYEIFFGEFEKWPVAVLGYSGLVQSHVLSLAAAGAFSVLFGLIFLYRLLKERTRLFTLLKAAGWTVLLNLWWLAPFVWFSATQPFGIFSTVPEIWLSALEPAQLFMGGVAGGALSPQMQLGLGLPLILAFGILALWLLFGRRDASSARLRGVGWSFLGFGALALWLCTNWFPWRLLARVPVIGPAVSSLQFPWRFLGLGTLFLALCGGVLAAAFAAAEGAGMPQASPAPTPAAQRLGTRRLASPIALALLVALCMPAAANIMDAALNNPDAKSLESSPNINHTYDGQYLYEGSDDVMLVAWGDDIKSDGEPEISGYTKNGLSLTFTYKMNGAGYLDLPLTWYPGYGGAQNERSPEGLVRIYPAESSGTLTVKYGGLWWLRVGDALSLLGLAAFIVITLKRKTANLNSL